MPFAHAGEIAALGVSFCWVATALALESAGRRVGSLAVNWIRLLMALGFLSLFTKLDRGLALPTDADGHAWFWLGLSGIVGFCIGDLCLFRAFVLIGTRLSLLMMSLVPPMTALVGWLLLNETLGLTDWIGMAMTVAGVAWVVLEREAEPGALAGTTGDVSTPEGMEDAFTDERMSRARRVGLALAGVGAVGQAVGLVFSKFGMGSYDAVAATQIRVITGTVGFAAVFTVVGWWPKVARALRHRGAMLRTGVGAFFGPFIGVSLSLAAVKYTQAGVAATLMALPPVIVIPVSVCIRGETVSPRAVAGSLLAVAGAAVLFL